VTTRNPTIAAAAGLQLLGVKQLSAALGVNPRTVWRLSAMTEAKQGNFPRPLRIGPKTVRWRLADVEAYLAALAGESAS
jgi:predicted DNA-binding transcriptional regulator AlpA